jgi:hypothetical protein
VWLDFPEKALRKGPIGRYVVVGVLFTPALRSCEVSLIPTDVQTCINAAASLKLG